MTKVNEILENAFPEIINNEKFNQWISKNQINYFSTVCDLKKYSSEKRFSNRLYGQTEKYEITILISPLNGAGTMLIKNNEIIKGVNDDKRIVQIEENKTELDKLMVTYDKMIELGYGKNENEKFVMDDVESKINILKSNLEMLGVKI